MKALSILQLPSKLMACIICLFLFSCQKSGLLTNGNNPAAGKSSVNIFLTDDQSLVFDHVLLDIRKVEIKVEDSAEAKHEEEHESEVDDNDHGGDVSGGWMAVDIHAGVYDILRFRNGLDTLFSSTSFSAAKRLRKLRLTLGTSNTVSANGITSPLILKDNDNFVVIKIDKSLVQVNSGGLTNFWIDIDAGRSIKKHGDDFELKPSVKVFSKEKAGSVEGRVLPKDAAVVVMAIIGTDTTSAKPEAEGEFKFIGLKPGTYSLLYHATASNYLDKTISNVKISGQDDVHVADVILHK